MRMLIACQAILFGFGGSSLPDNILAETAGDIVNGLIISAANTALSGTGLVV